VDSKENKIHMAGASDARDDVIPAGDNTKTNQIPRLICTVDISNASGSHAVEHLHKRCLVIQWKMVVAQNWGVKMRPGLEALTLVLRYEFRLIV